MERRIVYKRFPDFPPTETSARWINMLSVAESYFESQLFRGDVILHAAFPHKIFGSPVRQKPDALPPAITTPPFSFDRHQPLQYTLRVTYNKVIFEQMTQVGKWPSYICSRIPGRNSDRITQRE